MGFRVDRMTENIERMRGQAYEILQDLLNRGATLNDLEYFINTLLVEYFYIVELSIAEEDYYSTSIKQLRKRAKAEKQGQV